MLKYRLVEKKNLSKDAQPRGHPYGTDAGIALHRLRYLVCGGMAREALHLRERSVQERIV